MELNLLFRYSVDDHRVANYRWWSYDPEYKFFYPCGQGMRWKVEWA